MTCVDDYSFALARQFHSLADVSVFYQGPSLNLRKPQGLKVEREAEGARDLSRDVLSL